MGTDDIFKKRRAERKERKHDLLTPKPNSYLIVTEGAKTEPLYFEGLVKLIKSKKGGILKVEQIPYLEIHGEGCSTSSLVKKTDEIVNKSKTLFQNVWVVFDKDDFNDFDDAIKLAEDKGYNVAWSNQSFEYWIYLHFNFSDSALHRDDWCEKLDEIFSQNNINGGKYKKNDKDIFEIANEFNGVQTAIKNAKRRMSGYNKQRTLPSIYDPGTTVHILVSELYEYLD